MGLCIAQSYAMRDYEVALYSRTASRLDDALAQIRANFAQY